MKKGIKKGKVLKLKEPTGIWGVAKEVLPNDRVVINMTGNNIYAEAEPNRVVGYLVGRKRSSKNILFLSDMHVGSSLAVCTPEPVIKDTTVNPTPLQKKLYDHWCKVKDSLSKKHVFTTVVNGEPIDGDNKKEVGLDAWTTDFNLQIDDAVKLLKEFKTKYFVMTRGSGYHVKRGATYFEDTVASKIGATPYSTFNEGKSKYDIKGWHDNKHLSTRTDHHMNLKILDKVFSVTHHIAFTRWFNYQPMALAREMANLEYLRGRYWTDENFPSFIVRSHVHYYVEVRFSSTTGFTTPAWKLPDSFLFKGGLSGTAPSIGAIEVILESNGDYEVKPCLMKNEEYPKMSILELK